MGVVESRRWKSRQASKELSQKSGLEANLMIAGGLILKMHTGLSCVALVPKMHTGPNYMVPIPKMRTGLSCRVPI